MRMRLFPFAAAFCAAAMSLVSAQTSHSRTAAKETEFQNTKGAAANPKSALDKTTLEAYIRHLNVWTPQIQVQISDPKPSPIPDLLEVNVHASFGGASQDEIYYVSKDGRRIMRGLMYDVNQNPFHGDLKKLKTEMEPSFGTPGAPVVLVVFGDFECPFCKEEAKMLRENLPSAYPKEVRLYFVDDPLDQIHPWARAAAIAGRCIFRQRAAAFWEYHDWIYDHQTEITPENVNSKILDWAQSTNLDTLALSQCINTKATAGEVSRNEEMAKSLDISATPTLFINGRRITGGIAWPNLRQIIDYEIEYQKTARNAGEDCGCELNLPSPLGK